VSRGRPLGDWRLSAIAGRRACRLLRPCQAHDVSAILLVGPSDMQRQELAARVDRRMDLEAVAAPLPVMPCSRAAPLAALGGEWVTRLSRISVLGRVPRHACNRKSRRRSVTSASRDPAPNQQRVC
jgi:hypothetical protein